MNTIPIKICTAICAFNWAIADPCFASPVPSFIRKEFAQQSIASGTVRDGNGQPLENINVTLKGSAVGTQTNSQGQYRLAIPTATGILVFSGIGYTAKEQTLQGSGTYDVALDENTADLDEVVVVGYGSQKKSQITGAIASVSSAEIAAVPVTSPDQALQGRAAGVDVVASGNAPGQGATIRIRGAKSITASNDPLFVVDGIPISGGLNDINPNVIESMEVLKDASATAIYGARGSNGVVLITTKRGLDGKTRINYDTYFGLSSILNKVEVLGSDDWVKYKSASRGTDVLEDLLDPIELNNYQAGRSVDWQDLVLRKGRQQSHSIGVLGGNAKTKFALNANFLEQQGIVKSSSFVRGSIQANLDHQINDHFKIGSSTLLSMSKEQIQNMTQVLGQAMRIGPLGDLYNPDGSYRMFPTSEALLANPMLDLENDINRRIRTRIFASLFGEYEFMKGLKYRLNFGPDITFVDEGRMIGTNTSTIQGGLNRASNAKMDTKAYTLENLLTYTKNWHDQHNLEATLLQSIQQQTYESNSLEAQGIPSEAMLWHDLSAGQIRNFDSDQQQWSILSYMARINYGFKDRYLLTLTARRDGSSRFGQDRKYGFFPSVAAAWRLSQENFLKNTSFLTDLKLRASYGEIGNTALDPYQSLGRLVRRSYMYGSEIALGFEPGTLPNADLMWETSKQTNIGIDFALWNSRLSGSVELYNIRTTDLLLNRALAPHTGYQSAITNIGSTDNKGFELNLSSINLELQSGFRWTTNLNLAINRNKIIDLYGDQQDDVGNARFIGQPINVYYDLQFDGIWQEDEAEQAARYGRTPGQIKVRDTNNDGQINAEDRVILGTPFPKWSGGITNNFQYKGFDLSVFLNVRQGFLINSGIYALDNLEGRYNLPTFVNYWTPENRSNDFPKPVTPGANNPNLSTLRYKDGSFVRIRNINFGYTFKPNQLKHLRMESLRIYLSAQNPFTFTKYKGWDPEAGSEVNSYPSAKLFLLGLNVSF
ncbi:MULTISPECIES: SusC/RagA family TonB-linked outer membrane protein [Olivibacter]|uniref:SusC/RagA family TonB-linked outer membrane protein n=1 Tax=Olivibacter jilunii TaxID=985016 RepID=A0ABW6B7I0_9SPHI|nr:TonB-dependent receptor [Pseudosphingobacterium sp.]